MAIPAFGQTAMPTSIQMTIDSSPHESITLAPYQPATSPNFARVFTPETAPYQTAFVVLTNQSSKSIVALAAIWAYTDVTTGKRKTMELLCDSFQAVNAPPVSLPSARVLLGPTSLITEQLALGRGSSGYFGVVQPQSLRPLDHTAAVRVSIDLIVFSDGEMAGPDNLHTSTEIVARNAAAKQVAQQIRSAQTDGRELSTAVSQFLKPVAPAGNLSIKDVQYYNWLRRYAQNALNSPNPETFLTYLERLPEPINVHRPTN
jgi:hypothetical protein